MRKKSNVTSEKSQEEKMIEREERLEENLEEKREAVPVAAAAVTRWLEENSGYDMEVTFVCYSREMYKAYLNAVK